MTPYRFYFGLFLVTGGTLMLQIIQTRILSVVTWYHLAFFAISMAMFGMTAGSIWVYLRRERFTEKTLSSDVAYFSSAFALTTALCFSLQTLLKPETFELAIDAAHILTWLGIAVVMSIPFFFSGVVVSLALTRSPFPIGRVYCVDLLGAATGCLGVLWLLNTIDAPSAVFVVAAIIALGAWLFAASSVGEEASAKLPLSRLLNRYPAIALVLAVVAIANSQFDGGIQPRYVKGKRERAGKYMFREWNSFSRVAVTPDRRKPPKLWGASPKFNRDQWSVEERSLNIDGLAGTPSYRFGGDLEEMAFLRYDVTNLAYYMPDRPRVAVIGVGGGRDVLSAAQFGSTDVTGVEINPIFIDLLTSEPGFSDFTNITQLPGVRLVVDEGRSWFARSDEQFDIIQMSLIDTWAATGAGAFTLSENGLYTVEAWRVFLSRLRPNGVFTVSRWYRAENVQETGRMLSLAVRTLMERGVADTRRHVFLAAQRSIATLIVSESPLSGADVAALEDAAERLEHSVILGPNHDGRASGLSAILEARTPEELEAVTSGFELDLSAPTDERPFFFNQLPLNKPALAWRLARRSVSKDGVLAGNLSATLTLMVLFVLSLLLVVVTIILPVRSAIRDVGRSLTVGGTLYFLLIGIGFMMVEIGLLQRMSVFLGHPIYSLSVILFTLILTAGIGSLLSESIPLENRTRFVVWASLSGVYILGLTAWIPAVFSEFGGGTLLVRAAVCVAILAPAGALMGFGFPTGMRYIAAIDARPTAWFWGINGAAGVLASIVAVACSIASGISTTLAVGAACYLALIPTTLIFLLPREARATAG